jgi:hypothetical protein
MTGRLSALFLVGAGTTAALAACDSRPPFVVLTIEDRMGVATGFATISVGLSRASLSAATVDSSEFPLAVTVTANTGGDKTLWVEAYDRGGATLGRGQTRAHFSRQGTPTGTVQLAMACADAAECDDHMFCSGAESCTEGMCEPGSVPCAANVECATSTCMERGDGTGTCDTVVDHLSCGTGSYCNPVRGCVEGRGCHENVDCADTYVCNGEEQCVNLVCVGGIPPEVDDDDECTVDGCNDQQRPPIFHLALPSRDGNPCAIPGTDEPGGAGVCVAAKEGCVASECGDGVIFSFADEVCDDGARNSDAWAVDRHCNATCDGWGPACGDGVLQTPEESCDDGDRLDSGNGCDVDCRRNDQCGNQAVEGLFEACDDGNANECDGCLDSCAMGCVCSTGAGCGAGTWCMNGGCLACDTPARCGANCVGCGARLPDCGGVTLGCQCRTDPLPNGSCGVAARCDNGACVPCLSTAYCGVTCTACVEPQSVCDMDLGCLSGVCAGKPNHTRCGVATMPDRSYDLCADNSCVSPGCGDMSCNALGLSFFLGDSGQRRCYREGDMIPCPGLVGCEATDFCGQDAQYGWDAQSPASARFDISMLVAGEPVVRDNSTGLAWMRCFGGWSGSLVPGPLGCAEQSLFDLTYVEAVAYCDALTFGGYSDWHLPDVYEIASLIDVSARHCVDVNVFPAAEPMDLFVWSSSMNAAGMVLVPSSFWASCGVEAVLSSARRSVLCVRQRVPPQIGNVIRLTTSAPDITHSGATVVTDSLTKLMWQGCAARVIGTDECWGLTASLTWKAALAHCEGLTWAGFSDWRLPSVVEIASLYDPSLLDPLFGEWAAGWTSTTVDTDPWFAFVASPTDGPAPRATAYKLSISEFRCVRTPF